MAARALAAGFHVQRLVLFVVVPLTFRIAVIAAAH